MSSFNEPISVMVHSIRYEATDIVSLELRPINGALPAVSAGAHIDLQLTERITRSYSLMNSPSESNLYRIAVFRDPASRGGSRHVHEKLRVGQKLKITPPRNNFPLNIAAEHSIFIAGGIGVTPFLSMSTALNSANRRWILYYCVRTRDRAAFASDLAQIASAGTGSLIVNCDEEPGGEMLDIHSVIQAAAAGTHFYCCGPAGMLSAFRTACGEIESDRVHYEYFATDNTAATSGEFDVILARSGKRIRVPMNSTILEALLAAGISVPYSCQQGICGACEVSVLAGTPDHRDMLLSDEARAANKSMLICCSGSLGRELVLDL